MVEPSAAVLTRRAVARQSEETTMPIVPGNEQPSKTSGGSLWGLIVFLVVFGRPIYGLVRSLTAGFLSDQQLLMLLGGAGALIVLATLARRIRRSESAGTTTFPPSYTPSQSPSSSAQPVRPSSVAPSAPRFEPIITGKLVLVGVILASIMGGIGLLLWSL